MSDIHSKLIRSYNMSRIKSRDTKPELIVRSLLHRAGYRYRLHGKGLPGKPDIVFGSRHKVIFVHGCFWHRHSCPLGRPSPKTNRVFWSKKLQGNVSRDRTNLEALRKLGWDALVIWQCETKDEASLREKLFHFLESEAQSMV